MKNKLIVTFALLLFYSPFLFAQDFVARAKPRGSKAWGYLNEKGEWLVEPEYRTCYNFSPDGWAAIYRKTEGGYFFINAKNQRLDIELEKFDLLKVGAKEIMAYGYPIDKAPLISFDDGMCPVLHKGKWGFINTKGKLVHKPKYDRVYPFNDGAGSAVEGKNYYILHKDGKEIKVSTEVIMLKEFSDGMAVYKDKSRLAGYLDKEGNVAIAPQFESLGPFIDGLAWAKDAETKKVGFINKSGKWAIKPQFDLASKFDSKAGLARVKLDGKWMYVNTKGEMIEFDIDSEIISKFKNGLAKGQKKGKYGFYNNKGEWVIQPEFDAFGVFHGTYVPAEQKKRWGILDAQGNWVAEPTFEMIKEVIPLNQ